MALELLMQEVEGIPEDMIMEVVRFLRFIKREDRLSHKDLAISKQPSSKQRYREAGIYRDKGWIAEDFDAPLADFEGYM